MINYMLNVSYVNLSERLINHDDGYKFIKIMNQIFNLSSDQLYYQSDKGDWGESPEVVSIFYSENDMCVQIADIYIKPILSRLGDDYPNEYDRENSFGIIIKDIDGDLLKIKKEKSSAYYKLLSKVKDSFNLMFKLTDLQIDKIENISEKIKEKSNYLKVNGSVKLLVALPKDDDYFIDNFFNLVFKVLEHNRVYVVSTEKDKLELNNEDLANDIISRAPTFEDVLNKAKKINEKKDVKIKNE